MSVAEFKHQRLRIETDQRLKELERMIDFYGEDIISNKFWNRNNQISRDRIIREGLKRLKQDFSKEIDT